MNKIIYCKSCHNLLQGRKTLFCSIKCKNKWHQSYPAQKARGLERKVQLIQIAGGQCVRCGYKRNLASLTFHHVDSRKKAFKLDMRSLSNRTMDVVIEEFQKCQLLCHNCHQEIHNPELDLG